METKQTKIIVQMQDKVLREKTKDIPIAEIKSKHIQKVIDDMSRALAKEDDGIAIAAPQIGVSLSIFVVSGKLLALADKRYEKKLERGQDGVFKDLVFINPKVTKFSKEKDDVEEGCLSVRWKYGLITRSKKVTLVAHDEHGKKIERGASGLLAQVFQHECDHLNGILFIDNAYDVKDMPPSELKSKTDLRLDSDESKSQEN